MEKKLSVSVCSNSKRITINLQKSELIYIYIPMTKEENDLVCPDISDACWRIEVSNLN